MASKKNNNSLVAAIVFAAVAISGSLVFFGLQFSGTGMSDEDLQAAIFDGIDAYIDQEEEAAQQAREEANKPREVSGDFTDDDPVLGDPNAPVTIVEFSDYECPYCGLFYSETYPQIKEAYIETGKAKLVYRDFPLSGHRNAYPAALIAECVRDQEGDEAYFQMHDRLFETISDGFDYEALSEYAVSLGANAGELKECYDSGKFRDEIYADMEEGSEIGINGTPGFVINDKVFTGARDFSYFAEIIDAELADN